LRTTLKKTMNSSSTELTGVVALLLSAVCWLSGALFGSVEPKRCDRNPVYVLASAPSAPGADIFITGYQNYVKWVDNLSFAQFWFPVRCTIILAIPLIMCAFVFVYCRCRFVVVEYAFCLLGILIALQVPLNKIVLGVTAKAWLFAFSVFGLITLPWALSWLLARKVRSRKIVAGMMYVAIGVFWICTLWRN